MKHWLALFVCGLFLGISLSAEAEYFRQKQSDIDPDVFRIRESAFMGVRMDQDLELLDAQGRSMRVGDFSGKPLILIWSYYMCDGSCSSVNQELKRLLEGVKRQTLGEDYRVLTLSFDKQDTVESLRHFRSQLTLPPAWEAAWTFAVLKDPARIRDVTGRTGFNYFWAMQDKIFYHPNVFIFFSADGRIVRYLYALTNNKQDMELALLEARQGQFRMNETIDFVVGLCYSYNYKEGRYTYNIPLFVGVGALFVGISLLLGSIFVFRRGRVKERA